MSSDCVCAQEGYHELAAKEEEVKAVLLTGEDLISQGNEEDSIELKERLERLTKQLYDVHARADRQKVCFDSCMHFIV
jgi:hypothetical protein